LDEPKADGVDATSTRAEEDWAGIGVRSSVEVDAVNTGRSSEKTEPGAPPPPLAKPEAGAPEPPISAGGMNRPSATRVDAGRRVLGIGCNEEPLALCAVEPVVERSTRPASEEQPESAAAPAMMPANATARSAF
jgi:hypothetical protein